MYVYKIETKKNEMAQRLWSKTTKRPRNPKKEGPVR